MVIAVPGRVEAALRDVRRAGAGCPFVDPIVGSLGPATGGLQRFDRPEGSPAQHRSTR